MKKTVLVTGASRGIGKAIALKFAEQGYNVVVNCLRSREKLEKTASQIENFGAECMSFVGDMGDLRQTEQLFEAMHNRFGAVDVVVNNAGISRIGLLQDVSEKEWEEILRTNLTSVFHCSKLAITDMLQKGGGKIINISSVWGVTGASMEVAYSTTKGGINAFTKALAKELAPSNIQVNAVACGAIDTEMNSFLTDEELQMLCEEIPAGRMGTTKEVAELVYGLAGEGSYLTGQIIGLDGGWI